MTQPVETLDARAVSILRAVSAGLNGQSRADDVARPTGGNGDAA